jgi:CMP-N-acetylneuraminic acid synthetase
MKKDLVIATICARAGSKGVKNKNIIDLNGKPLIQYTIECAEKCKNIDAYVISTESLLFKEIIDNLPVSQNKRLNIEYIRPESLALDNTPKIQTIKDAIENTQITCNFNPTIIVDLDVGCPLRSFDDINNAIEVLINSDEYDCLTTVYESERNPYFNMLEEIGYRKYCLPKHSTNIITRRQDAPKVYSVSPAAMIWKFDSLNVRHLADGNWGIYEIPRERAIDIDTEFDLKLVKYLLNSSNSISQ